MEPQPHPSVIATRKRLGNCKSQWPLIIKTAGVSSSWLYMFARGEITNPTINTLQAVSDACDRVLSGEVV
jgi:hypothetical protein